MITSATKHLRLQDHEKTKILRDALEYIFQLDASSFSEDDLDRTLRCPSFKNKRRNACALELARIVCIYDKELLMRALLDAFQTSPRRAEESVDRIAPKTIHSASKGIE